MLRRTAILVGGWLALMTLPFATGSCGGDLLPFDPSCLASGTLIRTPLGDTPIERLRVGDLVFSVDPIHGTLHRARVSAVRSAERPCLALTTASGCVIVATAEHPFYLPVRGEYRQAGCWLAGDGAAVATFRDRGLTADPVIACGDVAGTRTVHDLTVDSRFHNFLAGGVLVHNKSPAGPDDGIPPPTVLGTVGEVLDVYLVPGMEAGIERTRPLPGSIGPFDVDVTTLGPDSIRILSSFAQPTDTLYFAVTQMGGAVEWTGHLELAIPSPAHVTEVRLVLKGGISTADVRIQVRAGGHITERDVTLPLQP